MKFRQIGITILLAVFCSAGFAQSDTTVTPAQSTPEIRTGNWIYYSNEKHTERFVYSVNDDILLTLDNNDIKSMAEFSWQIYQHDESEIQQTSARIADARPDMEDAGLILLSEYNGKQGVFFQVTGRENIIRVSPLDIRLLLVWTDQAAAGYETAMNGLDKKNRKSSKERLDKISEEKSETVIIRRGAEAIESPVSGMTDENGLPLLYIREWHIMIPLFEEDINGLLELLHQAYQDSKMADLQNARKAARSKTPARTGIRFFQNQDQAGVLLDSLNIFYTFEKNDIRKMYGFAWAEVPFTTKKTVPAPVMTAELDTGLLQPPVYDTTVVSAPKRPELQAGILETQLAFLPSFLESGGPHIYLPEFETALKLTPEQLREMADFARNEMDKLEPGKATGSQSCTTRYFTAEMLPEEMVGKEISPVEAEGQPHFRATYDAENQLVGFEYAGKTDEHAETEGLASAGAWCWNFLLNSPVRVDQFANRVKYYNDASGRLRVLEFLTPEDQTFAIGYAIYGLRGRLVEVRTEFQQDGNLTDLQPLIFDPNFSIVRKGWIMKALYGDNGSLNKIIVMENNGSRYYHYRYNRIESSGERAFHSEIYNQYGRLAEESTLTFNPAGILAKYQHFTSDRKPAGYRAYRIQDDQLITESYDVSGQRLSRKYRNLQER